LPDFFEGSILCAAQETCCSAVDLTSLEHLFNPEQEPEICGLAVDHTTLAQAQAYLEVAGHWT